jgi:uncharacterized protein
MAMSSPAPEEPVRLVRSADEPAAGLLSGDPGMVGLPSFIIGAVALGLVSIGVLPNAPTTAVLPIVLAATSVGLLLATIWSAVARQNAAAGIYGVFSGFYFSYALLQLGGLHGWFGIGPASIVDSEKLFQISWLVIITMLVLATLRLPVIFPALFALVDLALLFSLLQVIQNSTAMQKVAGWAALAAAAVGIYLFISSSFHATGGKALPVGKPVLHT